MVPIVETKDVNIRSAREYPTEWTCYPADEEDDSRGPSRADERKKQPDRAPADPGYLAGYWL